MMELVSVVCLSSDSTTCHSKAQPVLAQWVVKHPGWEIQRWTCQPEGSDHNT